VRTCEGCQFYARKSKAFEGNMDGCIVHLCD
jgi:hypothetical protein